MWRETLVAIQALVLLAQPAALAQTPLQALADNLLAESGSPGAVVMRGDADGVEIATAGVRALGEDAAIGSGDLWHQGSNTKSMTAMLVARLVEQGVVSWDDTVADHLGDVIDTISPAYREASFLHLLSHRSGLPANIGLVSTLRFATSDNDDMPAQRLRYAADILSQDPVGPLEETYHYSNAGYVVAGAMLEQATGMSWEELMIREVFGPLGLDSAGFGAPGSSGEVDQPRGHKRGLFGGLNAVAPGPRADNPPVMGPGAIVHMSAGDMAIYLQAHLAGDLGEDERFLSQESWQRLHTPPFGGRYALGWGVGDARLYHAGSNTMWLVQIGLDRETGKVFMVGVNTAPDEAAETALRAATGAVLD